MCVHEHTCVRMSVYSHVHIQMETRSSHTMSSFIVQPHVLRLLRQAYTQNPPIQLVKKPTYPGTQPSSS